MSRSLERATQRSLERGQAFIAAASALLQESGSDGFTVQQVADAAGQSLRTFYQHFRSKDDLLLALFEEELRDHADRIRRAVDQLDDPLDRLATFVTAAIAGVAPTGHTVGMSRYRLGLAASHPDELAAVQAPVVALARRLVAEAVEAGAIEPCDPDAAAYLLVTLKTAYLHSTILGNELGTSLPTPEELARFCVRGLGGSPGLSRPGR